MCLEIEKMVTEVNRFISKILLCLFVLIAWGYGVIVAASQTILGWKLYDDKYANNIYLEGVSYNLVENTSKNKNFSYLSLASKIFP